MSPYLSPARIVECPSISAEGLITKIKFNLTFERSTQANTVWVTANWYNERGQTGVACMPVSINLPAAAVVPQGKAMKIAAREESA